eukprot:TRINITY_DN16892_c0_g1_i1.p1 TRINITY_DN16892_c0_g1~~TRINITY_DN16892_c0_g1_i1.p1  ORF type:complete len:90 (-),score=6.44 TRINITY_DN16892_c0_g1_i1:14-283(-)
MKNFEGERPTAVTIASRSSERDRSSSGVTAARRTQRLAYAETSDFGNCKMVFIHLLKMMFLKIYLYVSVLMILLGIWMSNNTPGFWIRA